MIRVWRCKQQGDLWLALRRGRITCSRLGDVLAPPTTRASTRKGVSCPAGTEALCRAQYRDELVAERITRRATDHFTTPAMQDGIDRERFARMLYEAETQQVVEQIGFTLHPLWDFFGGSADGLCGDDGGVELKCPTEAVHLGYYRDIDLLIAEYKWQAIGNMICSERQWWDLVSFQPFFPDAMKLVRTRLTRDEFAAEIAQIEEAVPQFHAEVEAEIADLGQPPTLFEIPQANASDDPEYDASKSFVENCDFVADDVAP